MHTIRKTLEQTNLLEIPRDLVWMIIDFTYDEILCVSSKMLFCCFVGKHCFPDQFSWRNIHIIFWKT